MAESVGIIREKLKEISNLTGLYKMDYVSPEKDCILLEKNARYMTKDQMDKLTKNVEKDGFLSQIPLGIKEGDKYRIISGNHRVKAAIKAKIEFIMILYVENISRDKELGFQLSHNAISCQDDISILIELYNEIKTIELKEYSGIDEKELMKYKSLSIDTIQEDGILLNEVRLNFCDRDLKTIDKILPEIEKKLIKERGDRIVFGDFFKFVEIMSEIKRKMDIKNNSVAFMKMIDICEKWLEDNKE